MKFEDQGHKPKFSHRKKTAKGKVNQHASYNRSFCHRHGDTHNRPTAVFDS